MTDLDLPLTDPAPNPRELAQHPDALLDAFKHSGLRRYGYSFERAIASDAIRRCLAVSAEIRIKRQLEASTCVA